MVVLLLVLPSGAQPYTPSTARGPLRYPAGPAGDGARVISLSKPEWRRLYKEVAVIAVRMTYTRDAKQQFTARDRAQEALQRACERMLSTRPAWVTTYEQARDYLASATRSELYNAGIRAGVRRETEKAAVVDENTTTVGGGATISAEQRNLEAALRGKERGRADRMLELTREELAGDRIALRHSRLAWSTRRTRRTSRRRSSTARSRRSTSPASGACAR